MNEADRVTVTLAGDPLKWSEEQAKAVQSAPEVQQRFDVMGRVGQGAMGDVLLVKERDLQRVVALKVAADRAQHGSLAGRFFTEAQVTAQLDHPNIVPVYGMQRTEDGKPAFSMKLIRGETFDEYIKEARRRVTHDEPLEPTYDLETRMEHFTRVCDAMSYAHARGVIHRDLKPQNLMVGAFNEVYVMDWGIAKVVETPDEGLSDLGILLPDAEPAKTQVGKILGTPAYLSPEQARGDELTPRSDQYTLGLIFFELVALRRANGSTTSSVAIVLAQDGHTETLTGPKLGAVHPDLNAIFKKATALDPEDRYPSVGHLGEDVRRFLRHEETLARPDNLVRRGIRWGRGHPGTVVATVGTMLLTAAVVVVVALSVALGLVIQADIRSKEVAKVISQVGRRAHEIDAELLRYQALLTGVTTAATQLYRGPQPVEPFPVYLHDDLKNGTHRPDDYQLREGYDMTLSITDHSVKLSPGVEADDTMDLLERMAPMRDVFREAALRSHSDAATAWPEAMIQETIGASDVPAAWIYLGLEPGILLNYPGQHALSDEYDATRRPWYQASQDALGPHWGDPYPDDSGYSILVPCNAPIFDGDGEVVGVAGLDVTLDTVIDMISLDDVEGARTTYLVDREGKIVVSTEQAGLSAEGGLNDNQAISQEPFPVPQVYEAIRRGDDWGFVDGADEAIVFDRMDALGWTYVVRLDPR